jgi:His/Glu/Gln/Arg/opine family amino acid ABC transporter permease subunit
VSFLDWVAIHGPSYLGGLAQTALVALWASLGAVLWGTVLTFIRLTAGKWGGAAVDSYVQLLRNIPVLLPIYLIYFGLPGFGIYWPAVVCGGLALILQNGAYVSEIFRGGVKAIDRVQFDAARSLGLSPWATFRRVTLPQLLVYSLPALGNQVVLLLKDTSLLSVIAVAELTMRAKVLTERTASAYESFLVAAILYLLLVSLSEMAFRSAHRAVRWR